MKKIIVAIDGHSSCGKSTIAKTLAQHLGYIYVDTGAMYRAITLYALRKGLFRDDGTIDDVALRQALHTLHIGFAMNAATAHADTLLNGENVEQDIRTMAVSERVSRIAALPFVREALVAQQRAIGKDKGIVMDGRDIGTTVFPAAELKIFVTATAAVRARRRYDELLSKGMAADYEAILRNVQERDYLDSHRTASPLRCAADAILLDNSEMSIAEQDRWVLAQALAVVNA